MSKLKVYKIKFKNPYIINKGFIDIAFQYSDVFSLFRTCGISEEGFYENFKDVCLKRFYEILSLIGKSNKNERFFIAAYLQEAEQWNEMLSEAKKYDMDLSHKLKSDYIDCNFKILNELNDFLIQKKFTNYSEANMIIGLGEQIFFKSNEKSKRIVLKNFNSVFEYPEGDLRDLAFYINENSFINVNTNEGFVNFCCKKDEKDGFLQILEDLKKLDGIQIEDIYTISEN